MPLIQYIDKKIKPERAAEIDTANSIIDEYAAKGYGLTLRQLYYQLVARGLVKNSDREYKRIGDLISDGRMLGLIDWDAISDRLRPLRGVTGWQSPQQLLRAVAHGYRTDRWKDQPQQVEVWVEKDALAEVVAIACGRLDAPFLVCRGFASQTALWEAAQRIRRRDDANRQDTIILHLADHDPSGVDMTRDIEARLSLFTERAGCFRVQRIALTMAQVERYNPPPNPAKESDSRSASYIAEYGPKSWELDALDPGELDALITRHVRAHIDARIWDRDTAAMEAERRTLAAIARKYEQVKKWLVTKGGQS